MARALGLLLFLAPTLALGQAAVGLSTAAKNRIFFDVGATGALVSGQLSGDPDPIGVTPDADDVRQRTSFLIGDLRLGSVGRSGVNTYAMVTGAANLGDEPDRRPAETGPHSAALHRHPADPYGASAFFLHQVYGEIQGFGTEGAAAKIQLRAGRHHHWGLRSLTFDGATLGYRGDAVDIALRGGRRAGIYAQSQGDPGLFVGADARIDLSRNDGPPLLIRGELMMLSREIDLTLPRNPAFRGDDFGDTADVRVAIGDLGLDFDVNRDLLLSASVEFAEAVPGHLRLGVRWSSEANHAFRLDVDQKIGNDLPYDLAMGRGIRVLDERTGLERRSTYEVFRLNIPDRQPYTDVEAGFLARLTPWLAIEPALNAHLVIADADERSPYDADHFGWGLSAWADAKLDELSGVEVELGYHGDTYTRDDVDTGLITDAAAGAEGLVNEVDVLVRYTRARQPTRFRRLIMKRWLTLGLGGFVRLTTLENRYETLDEQLVGAQAQARLVFAEHWTVDARYEAATASDVSHPELGLFHLARLRLSAAW